MTFENGGILDVDDKFVADGGENISDDLRQNDVEHCLRMRHTDSGSAFKLTLVDGNDTAAYYFCHIYAPVLIETMIMPDGMSRERISAACPNAYPQYITIA